MNSLTWDGSALKQTASIDVARANIKYDTQNLMDVIQQQQKTDWKGCNARLEEVTKLVHDNIWKKGETKKTESKQNQGGRSRTKFKCEFCQGLGHTE